MLKKQLNAIRTRRANRTRVRIKGTRALPRLSVFRSNKHIYAQLIDDASGRTLASVSSLSFSKDKKSGKILKSTEAGLVGAEIAKKAADLGIKSALFDRGAYKFHGRLKMLCEGARKAGLKI